MRFLRRVPIAEQCFRSPVLRRVLPLAAVVLTALALVLPLAPQSETTNQTPEAQKQEHPRISAPAGDCLRCHLRMHREIAADWEASKHGKRNVPCITCHGAVGVNFIRQPGATRCVACHAAMVDSMKLPAMKMAAERGDQACWNCHSPHRLNPHAALFRNEPEEEKAP